MDIQSAIIALSLILISVAPFYVMIRNNKKKANEFLNTLQEMARENSRNIDQHDIWNHAAIGTDPQFDMVFFVKKTKEGSTQQHIPLADIQRTRVINSTRSVTTNNGRFNVTDKIELAFSFQDRTKSEMLLNFFDVNTDGLSVTKELRMAEKWAELINAKINHYSLVS